MFNFFKKNEDKPEDKVNNIKASITYFITEEDKVIIDVALQNYNLECTEYLAKILDVLSQDISYIETINIIKSGLSNKEHENLLLHIFTRVANQVNNKIVKYASKEIDLEAPCIKPSDML